MIQIVTDTTWKKSDPNPKKPIPAGQAGIPSSSCP